MDAAVRSVIVMAAMMVVAQIGALLMVGSVLDEEYQAFEDPNDPLIPVYYAIAMVLFTFAILYIIKKKREDVV
ncbi:MAG: presenilin family intramembrane aspartyl protease, partial [Thermoplasmata archaeon]|nr:presenilin family intramembrane aspartyl protease [Thermoplasmata archaeon]